MKSFSIDRENNDYRLPVTEGFFFGVSDGSEKAHDLEFIRTAREASADGDTIFYSSWW